MDKVVKEKYLNDPTECPKCNSYKISADCLSADGSTAWSRVECLACGAIWKDIYTLTDVEMGE